MLEQHEGLERNSNDEYLHFLGPIAGHNVVIIGRLRLCGVI